MFVGFVNTSAVSGAFASLRRTSTAPRGHSSSPTSTLTQAPIATVSTRTRPTSQLGGAMMSKSVTTRSVKPAWPMMSFIDPAT